MPRDYYSVIICGGATSARVFVRHVEQALAAPDSNDTHVLRVTPIDDAKRRPDQLAQKGLVELRDDPAHVGMIGQRLDARDDFAEQALADIGYTLFGVPGPYRFQIGECGFGEPDGNLRACGYFKPSRALASARDSSRPASRSARPATTARMNARSSSAAS